MLHHKKPFYYYLLIIGGFLLLTGIARYLAQAVVKQDPIAATDFSVYWSSGRLLSTGRDPYSPEDWDGLYEQMPSVPKQDATFVYPLPTAVLFIPLSFLSESDARDVWLVLSQLMIVSMAIVSIGSAPWTRRPVLVLPFIIGGLFIYVPAMGTIMNGQIGGLLGLDIAVAIYLWSRKKWRLGGAAAGLLIFKPTGAALFLGGVSIWLVLRRKWSGLAGILLSSGGLIGLACIIQPDWILDWLRISFDKAANHWAAMPTLWGVSAAVMQAVPFWPVITAILAATVFVSCIVMISQMDSEQQVLWLSGILLPLSMIITPYVFNYDLVVLIPTCVTITAILDRGKAPFAVVSLVPLLVSLLTVFVKLLEMTASSTVWWILFPAMNIVIFLNVWRYGERKKTSSSLPNAYRASPPIRWFSFW